MNNQFFLKALEGEWRFARTITVGVAMEGTAKFTRASPGKFSYFEEGRILETSIAFNRAYDYIVENADLEIIYGDGPGRNTRFLYFENLIAPAFPFSGKADHLCGKDHYAAEFLFTSETVFFTRYDVLGPEKSFVISTDYTKL